MHPIFTLNRRSSKLLFGERCIYTDMTGLVVRDVISIERHFTHLRRVELNRRSKYDHGQHANHIKINVLWKILSIPSRKRNVFE